MDLMSNVMFPNPVENPVPAKNIANPKLLNAFRHWSEIVFCLQLLRKTKPTNSPNISVLAVEPKDKSKDNILKFPIIFPKRAVMHIRISSG